MQFNEPNKKYSNPFIKYNGFIIEKIESDKYPELVQLSKTPKPAIHLLNKRYVTTAFAIKAVDDYSAEKYINSGRDSAIKEMVEIGLDPDDVINNMED